MTVVYIIILAISAWFMAYGLRRVLARGAQLLKRPLPMPEGVIALGVALAMLIVVGAPAWLFAAVLMLAALSHLPIRKQSLRVVLLIAALPLMASPLLGAASGFALDAALIAAAVLGESHGA